MGAGPALPLREGGDHLGVRVAPAGSDDPLGEESLEHGCAGKVVPGVEEAGVQVTAGLEFHPGGLTVGQKHGGQPEPRESGGNFGDQVGPAAHVGVETGAQMGQFGPAGVGGDHGRITAGDQVAGGGAGACWGLDHSR